MINIDMQKVSEQIPNSVQEMAVWDGNKLVVLSKFLEPNMWQEIATGLWGDLEYFDVLLWTDFKPIRKQLKKETGND